MQIHFDIKNKTTIDTKFSGSTANIVVISGNYVICANIGDSRAVLGSSLNGSWEILDLSKDHKPEVMQERLRIEKLGGIVEPCKGDI